MNYIRGAISTISAPYQYYKELPPINPSTLTGAIDVIVVQRAAKDGETELACSPFHVRFGKWQVLRPSEKTVTVTVNGKPIPFNMKIGEAGEAFFVFETDDDVPDDLITSPILQPTRPEDDPDVPDVPTDRFGAKPDSDDEEQEAQKQEEQTKAEIQEPDFLDLNDSGQSRPEGNTASQSLPSPPPSPPLKPTQVYDDPDAKVDAMLKTLQKDLHLHDVEYRHGVALDAEGYHTHEHHHGREASEQTITDHGSDLLIPHSQSQFIASSSKAVPFPRATSEPPPDFEEEVTPPPGSVSSKPNQLTISPPVQAYSWEWGAFPQPSPMTATFSKSGRLEAHSKGKRKATATDSVLAVEDMANRESGDHHRSRSVPPVIDDVATLRGDEDSSDDEDPLDHQAAAGYGAGGRLAPSKSDPKRFAVVVEGRKMRFDLSIVSDAGVFHTPDELEAARTFEEGRIEYSRFLDDGQLVDDPKLVIRWAGDHYITQDDGSPLKDALSLWRQAALQESASRFPPRPISPVSDEEEGDEDSARFSERTPLTTSPERKHHDRANAITSSQSVNKRRKFVKTLRLTSDQLKSLELKPGPNSITFSLSSTGVVACTARIFVWDHTDLIVVSDIDGTITKSDGLGHVFAMIGRDWTHLGVAKLYTDICRNGYKIMYLTSRAIGQADATRGYLKGIKQNDYQLPEGPVIMSPDRLMASLHREVIMRKPEVFKMACLRDIRQLFGDNAKNSFYAGFGNRITDALSYRSVNVPSSRIFTIDSSGEVKLELLELAGYKSSYIHMTDLVDQMFPPIHRKWAAEYTDFNYWKAPIQEFSLPDLSPPSPALSARSDTSNQSTLARIRNFSLVGSRQPTLVPTRENAEAEEQGNLSRRSSRLIQMSSFERLSNTLSNFTQTSSGGDKRRSMSPMSHSSSSNTYADSDDEYDEDAEDPAHRRRRDRRRSMTSMPGSLDDEQFGFDEEDEEDEGEGSEEYDSEGMTQEDQDAAAERALDEDVMKVAEMDDIPYL
ncbi:hypothetical protein EYR40_004912 [Pleurotus pulmonarius]|nr:hypothetical protein EYR40_004912 [Pleurotus pulmonarius]